MVSSSADRSVAGPLTMSRSQSSGTEPLKSGLTLSRFRLALSMASVITEDRSSSPWPVTVYTVRSASLVT